MILQKAQINIKAEAACKTVLDVKANRDTLLDHQICAGDSNTDSDTCKG